MKKISLRWRVTIAAAFVLTLFCVAMTQSSIRDANLIIADPILKLRTEAIADPILNGDQNFSPDTALDETVYNGLDNFTQRSYLFMLAAIGGGSFLVYLLAGYSLQPVKKLSSSIEAISEKQLSSRIQGFDSKDEIAKLADDFNAMMDRLEIAFLREKRFSSNAAHELRTPLTIIRTNLEILAMNETPAIEDYEHVVKIIKKQNQRMIALVEDLFALSAMKSSSIEDVFDVKEIIVDIIREMQPLANQRKIDIQSELSSGLIKGNPIIFRQAVANLIENGIKHKGFSVIEGLSVCPTYYGRKNKKGSAVDMYNWQKDHCIDTAKATKMTPEELEGKVIIGEMSRCEKPEYTDMYMEIIHKCGGDKE